MGLDLKISGTLPQIVSRIAALLAENSDDTVYDCELKEHREKRSLTANAYYWQLIGKYANWARVSKERLHNEMLAAYGQQAFVDDIPVTVVLPDTDQWKELTAYHVKPTSKTMTGKHGEQLRVFYLMYGSHTYDSYEMAVLIDGLISEIQGSEAPIETLTPYELELLKGYSH